MKKPARKYIVIEASVVGDQNGFEILYGWSGTTYSTHEEAKKVGFESRESDDFNICVLEGRTLVGYFWMNEPMNDPDGMAAIAKQNGFRYQSKDATPCP